MTTYTYLRIVAIVHAYYVSAVTIYTRINILTVMIMYRDMHIHMYVITYIVI